MSDDKGKRPATRFGVDFLAGVICFAVSIYVMCKSVTFWKEDYVDVFYYSSGLMPMIIGICLCIFSIIYIIRTIKENNFKDCLTDLKNFFVEFVKNKQVHKALVGIVIFWIYIFLMLGKMPFWFATFIILSTLLLFINWEKNWRKIVNLLIISAASTGMIILIFQVIFKVPMP